VPTGYSRPYRPQTNGKIDRFHSTLAFERAYVNHYASDHARATTYQVWIHEIAVSRELPAMFRKTRNGLPIAALVMLTVFGGAFAMLPDITSLLTFGSAVFLGVFGATNVLAFLIVKTTWSRLTSLAGSIACFAALAVLVTQLVMHDHATLALIGTCLAGITLLRLSFVWNRHRRRAVE